LEGSALLIIVILDVGRDRSHLTLNSSLIEEANDIKWLGFRLEVGVEMREIEIIVSGALWRNLKRVK
jgi:hypothetical protein